MTANKTLRTLLLMAFTVIGSLKAHAFQMIVIDQDPLTLNDIYSSPYGPFSFVPCEADAGVDPTVYQSCFTAENLTGSPLTQVSVFVPLTTTATQPSIDCPTAGAGAFSACTSTAQGNGFLLTFTGGSIPTKFPENIFTIAITGTTDNFGPSTVFANTPEPDSLLLLATGLVSGAGTFLRRRTSTR